MLGSVRLGSGDTHYAGRSGSDGRIAGIEWLRLTASIAIVLAHLGTVRWVLGIAGMQVFTIVMVVLAGNTRRRGVGSIVAVRAKHLLLPWVVWCGVYGSGKIIGALIDGQPLVHEFRWAMLIGGTATHLWFLPFAFAVTVVIAVSGAGKIGKRSRRHWLLWSGVAAVAVISCAKLQNTTGGLYPLHQYLYALPGVPVGLALTTIEEDARRGRRRVAVVGIVLVACLGVLQFGSPTESTLVIGLGLSTITCSFALSFRKRAGPIGLWLGGVSYGIYLIHPLPIRILTLIAPSLPEMIIAIIVLIASCGLTMLLKRTALRGIV